MDPYSKIPGVFGRPKSAVPPVTMPNGPAAFAPNPVVMPNGPDAFAPKPQSPPVVMPNGPEAFAPKPIMAQVAKPAVANVGVPAPPAAAAQPAVPPPAPRPVSQVSGVDYGKPRPDHVGVQGLGSAPRPGVSTADQGMDLLPGPGHGTFEMNGKTDYLYAPQQPQAPQAPQAVQVSPWEQERRNMIRDLHSRLTSLVDGTGMAGNIYPMTAEQRANMASQLGQSLSGMMGADVAAQGNALQYGNDPRRNPAYQAAMIGQMQSQSAMENAHAQHYQAQAEEAMHPERQVDLMRAILSDPVVGPNYLAMKNVDPETQMALRPLMPQGGGSFSRVGVNAGNLGAFLSRPQNETLASIVGSPDMSLLERIRRAAQIPGTSTKGSPENQALQAWLGQQYTDPAKWQEDTYIPPDPNDQVPFLGRLTGLGAAALGQVFGDHTSGTGLNWHNNFRDRKSLNDLLTQLNLTDPTAMPR